MEISKSTIKQELVRILEKVFQLPEVDKVMIRDIEIFASDENDKIDDSIDECYHDVLSDIDVGIHVTLHPEDLGNGHGYHSNLERIGLPREDYLGLAYSNGNEGLFQMFRLILKSGIHRYGYHEHLEYRNRSGFSFVEKDETYNMIANKIYSVALAYDRLIKRSNPKYEERSSLFFEIWKEYDAKLDNE